MAAGATAASLLPLREGEGSKGKKNRMAAGEEAATVFVETSLGTHLAVSFPARNTTVAHLKRIVSDEHAASFPLTGQIAVESFKVRRRGSWYHLTDSVPVRAAFHGVRGAWHLHAHVLPHSAPAAAAAHPECDGVGNVHMLHHVLCSQQNAIGDAAATDPQGSDAPSTDRRLGDAHEDGYSPVKGAGVIEDPRGRKRFREKEDGDRDQSVPVGCDGSSPAALVCSVTQDGQNECRHDSVSKRICAAAREDGLLDDSDDEVLEDEGALDDEGLDFIEKKEEAVSARPSDLAEPPVELRDHEAKSITNDEEPKLSFSVNKNDFAAATEKHADGGMAQEKLVAQRDHLDTSGAEVVLQNCNSKDTSAIHSEHVSDCHQHEGSSRSFDLKCCKSSKSDMLTDQVADRKRICSDVERAPQQRENDHTSDALLHDLDDCARSSGEKPICGQKEPSIAEVCNSASSKKGKVIPPCVETLKEFGSSEKEAKVCNGERSSSKGTDHLPRAGAMKEGQSSEKEEMSGKVKEKEPLTNKACNGKRRSSKGTDHPPCAGSIREGNSSEREGVAHGENQSTRTVTLVDLDGTKWEVELDDSFELGPQESSSFSWSEKEDAEEIHSDSAKPRQNAEEFPEGAPENGGTMIPTERSDLPRHGSFETPTSSGPTESKHAGATSADGAEQGAWERKRRPRDVVRKIPNSRAAKMYGYR